MPFHIVRNDITAMKADAIVNTANPEAAYSRGIDGAIYRAAGAEKLLAARRKIGAIAVGEADITPAFALNAKYIIHTAGPVWQGGSYGEAIQMKLCYENSLRLALKHGCKSIAFPLISTGTYGFPKGDALQIALSAIREFLSKEEMTVYLAVFDKESFELSGKLFADIDSYIDENYVTDKLAEEYNTTSDSSMPFSSSDSMHTPMAAASPTPAAWALKSLMPEEQPSKLSKTIQATKAQTPKPPEAMQTPLPQTAQMSEAPQTPLPQTAKLSEAIQSEAALSQTDKLTVQSALPQAAMTSKITQKTVPQAAKLEKKERAHGFTNILRHKTKSLMSERSIDDVIAELGETFQQRLLRLIDERGLTDVEVYKRANLDRKLFSKIRCNTSYRPKKATAIALALALELNLDETKDLLSRAELALSPSSKFDLIIQYFIDREVYDIYAINLALFQHGQPLLGE